MQVISCICALFWCTATYANTFWVNNLIGSDSNTGTQSLPWKTLSKATAILMPGDELVIQEGRAENPYREIIQFKASGTPDKRITVRGEHEFSKPYIVGNGQLTLISVYEKEFINIMNLVLADTSEQGIEIMKGSNNITIDGVEIYNIGKNGILAQGGHDLNIRNCKIDNVVNSGIALIGHSIDKLSNTLIEKCAISNVDDNDGITLHQDGERYDLGINHIIKNNKLTQCGEEGIDITSGEYVVVENNETSLNNGGISIGHGAKHVTVRKHRSVGDVTFGIVVSEPSVNVSIEDSYFAGANNSARLSVIGLKGGNILRNIFETANSRGSVVDFSGEVASIVFDNNVVTSTTPRNGSTILRVLDHGVVGDSARIAWSNNIWWDPSGNSRVFYDPAHSLYNIDVFRSLNRSNDQFGTPPLVPPLLRIKTD